MASTANIEYFNSLITAPSAPACTGNTGADSSFTAGQQANVQLTWVSAVGETVGSTSTLVTITSNTNHIAVTIPAFPTGAIAANVYCSNANAGATVNKVAQVTAAGTYNILGFASSGAATPPGTNTAAIAANDIENGGTKLRFNKSDDITTTTTPIVVPTSAGTNYSFVKYLGIMVTVAAATTLSNLSIALGSAPTTGFGLFAAGLAATSYVQAGTGAAVMTDNGTTDVTASGTTPTVVGQSSTRLSTTPFVYDATGGSANVSPANQLVGKLCPTVFGAGNSYTGGGGAVNTGATNTVIFAYDEA